MKPFITKTQLFEFKHMDHMRKLEEGKITSSSKIIQGSIFENFVNDCRKEHKYILIAMEEKVLEIVKQNQPEVATKLIMELIWITKDEISKLFVTKKESQNGTVDEQKN